MNANLSDIVPLLLTFRAAVDCSTRVARRAVWVPCRSLSPRFKDYRRVGSDGERSAKQRPMSWHQTHSLISLFKSPRLQDPRKSRTKGISCHINASSFARSGWLAADAGALALPEGCWLGFKMCRGIRFCSVRPVGIGMPAAGNRLDSTVQLEFCNLQRCMRAAIQSWQMP